MCVCKCRIVHDACRFCIIVSHFAKTYQQRTNTPKRNKPTTRPNVVQPTHHQPTRVRTPTPQAAPNRKNTRPRTGNIHTYIHVQYTVILCTCWHCVEQRPPPVNTISRAVQQQQHPTVTSNSQVPYRPLANERTTRQQQQPAAAEEEMNDCCCCIC